jgi:hypothetical protein
MEACQLPETMLSHLVGRQEHKARLVSNRLSTAKRMPWSSAATTVCASHLPSARSLSLSDVTRISPPVSTAIWVLLSLRRLASSYPVYSPLFRLGCSLRSSRPGLRLVRHSSPAASIESALSLYAEFCRVHMPSGNPRARCVEISPHRGP